MLQSILIVNGRKKKELEFDDDATEEEIEEEVNELYNEWLVAKNQGGWWVA